MSDQRHFTDNEVDAEIALVKQPSFFGELVLRVFGGKIRGIQVSQHKKPKSE